MIVAESAIFTVFIPRVAKIQNRHILSFRDFKNDMYTRSGSSRTVFGMGTNALPFNTFALNPLQHLHSQHPMLRTWTELPYEATIRFGGVWLVPPAANSFLSGNGFV
jgi:hypothetical protein